MSTAKHSQSTTSAVEHDVEIAFKAEHPDSAHTLIDQAAEQVAALEAVEEWGSETVWPLFVSLAEGEISHATPVAGRMSTTDWLSLDHSELAIRAAPPHEMIRDLVVGRVFPGTAYSMLGDLDLLPVMCAQEVLDLVGVASPTALHMKICAQMLREHVCEPKLYMGRACWPIFPRFNDGALEPGLAKSFPVPENDKYKAVHPMLEAADGPKERREFVLARRLFTAEVDHAVDNLDE